MSRSVCCNWPVEATPAIRPKASLLLLAYNQEAYVEAAVASAFAQSYSPLEIILSDDFSNDRTIEIMQDMARDYSGQHHVIVCKRSQNLGLSRHINALMEMASGDILVLAAGDDVCEPTRVERLIDSFMTDPSAMLVHSDVIEIDAQGMTGPIRRPPTAVSNPSGQDLVLASSIYIGATGALRRELIATFGAITEERAFEDLVMGFRASLLGGLRYLPEPLLRYRTGIGLSSMGARQSSFATTRHRHAEIMLATLRQREADLTRIECAEKPEMLAVLKTEQARLEKIRAFHAPDEPVATKASGWLAYLHKIASHGWFGVTEMLRHLKFAIKRHIA